MKNSYQLGLEGEEQALRFLLARGYQLLDKRVRIADGEIDLVMREKNITCMIEVKYRPGDALGKGLESVTDDKRRRLYQAALAYCRLHPGPFRVDILEISRAGAWHIRDIFHEANIKRRSS